MRIVISALAILFGLLHIIAAGSQHKSKDDAVRSSAVIMICGGIAVVCAAAHLAGGHILHADTLSAAAGGMLICFAAYLNGKQSGNFHLSHHIVRGAVAVLLVAGFLIW